MLKFFADESRDPKTSLWAISLKADIRSILGPLSFFHMREGHVKQYPEVYGQLKQLIVKGRVMFAVADSIQASEHRAILSLG